MIEPKVIFACNTPRNIPFTLELLSAIETRAILLKVGVSFGTISTFC